MEKLHFIKYDTMNSWNNSTAPAFNLKIHNVIPGDLQNNAYELLECEDFYFQINEMIRDFDIQNNYTWQAGFNGRSGGYLVLYRGGQKDSGYKSYCTNCHQRNYRTIEETGNKCGKCGEHSRVNYTKPLMQAFTYAGKHIDFEEVPKDVLNAFKQLAEDIVAYTIEAAKNGTKEEEYTITKTRKVLA